MTRESLSKILRTLRAGLAELLGDRLEAVYLFGSQARGDARPDSDIDVLIVIRGNFDYFQMMDFTSDLAWQLSHDNDVVISRVLISQEKFDQADTVFLMNARCEAVLV